MVLVDSNASCPGDLQIPYAAESGWGEKDEDRIVRWYETCSMRPTRYTYRDYHFEKSESTLESSEAGKHKLPGQPDWQIYDYPGEYAQRFDKPDSDVSKAQAEGKTFAEVRMQEEEAAQRLAGGTSNCRGFVAGSVFALTDHPCPDFNQKYLLTSIHHSV